MILTRIYFKQWSACALAGLMCCTSLSYAAEPAKTTSSITSANERTKVAQKWRTDEHLRQGMDDIRKTIVGVENGIKTAALKEEDYRKLAQEVNAHLAGVISTRQIDNQTEIAFRQIVMVDLNQYIEQMQSSTNVKLQHVWALGMLQVLRNYGQYFQHPGWTYA